MMASTIEKARHFADWILVSLVIVLLLVIGGCRQESALSETSVSASKDTDYEGTKTNAEVMTKTLTEPESERLLEKWSLSPGCSILSLSPDNVWIVFHCDSTQGESSLSSGTWVGKIQERDSAFLLSKDLSNWPTAKWSPDGTMLILTRFRGKVQLFQNGDWENGRLLHKKNMAFSVVWSPNSRHIAVTTLEPGVALALLHLDGTVEVLLRDVEVKQPPNLNFGPTWSPDGSQLAYLTLPDWNKPFGRQLWVMDITSKNQQLLFETEEPLLGPVWSPDGRFIAFEGPQYSLHIFDIAADELHRVPIPDKTGVVTPAVYHYVWAQRGDRLAVWTTTGLWVVSVDGRKVEFVSEKKGRVIRWSSDDRVIVAKTRVGDRETLELIPVN